jgi:hypothetical protein
MVRTLGKMSRSLSSRAAMTSALLASFATRFGGAFTSLSARSAGGKAHAQECVY